MLMIEKLSDYCVHMFKSDHIFKKPNVYVNIHFGTNCILFKLNTFLSKLF